MVLGKLPVPGRPTIWITVGQGPTTLTVGAGGVCLDIFTLIYPFSPLSPSLWETPRYTLKYCFKGPLNPKQPTNQFLDKKSWDETSRYRTNCMIPSDSSYFCDKKPIKRCILTQIYITRMSHKDFHREELIVAFLALKHCPTFS